MCGHLNYFSYLFRKSDVLTPRHILEEIAKPVTLALRLFGELLSDRSLIACRCAFPIALFTRQHRPPRRSGNCSTYFSA
jgi:F0F1-type ATP synthase membrane subunit a